MNDPMMISKKTINAAKIIFLVAGDGNQNHNQVENSFVGVHYDVCATIW